MNMLAALVLIGILVFIHEFGHFIVAKFCGVHCTVFSIGYGKRLIGIEIGGTDYRISMLPFGGYVMMAGGDPFGDGTEDDALLSNPEDAFMRKPVWQRLLIVSAGPVFNLVLPIVAITRLLMAGEPQPAAVVGGVEWNSSAHKAGLQAGDTIEAINDQPFRAWGKMSKHLKTLDAGEHVFHIKRAGQSQAITVRLAEQSPLGVSFLRYSSQIGVDDPASPAGKAGLQTGDTIVSANGAKIADFVDLQAALQDATNSLSIEYTRQGETQQTTLTPESAWTPKAHQDIADVDPRWGILPATIFVAKVSQSMSESSTGLFSGCSQVPPTPSPALANGIEPGDRFVQLDDRIVHDWGDVLKHISATMDGEGESASARPVKVKLMRNGQLVTFDMTPQVVQDTDAMGRYRFRPILGVTRSGDFVDGPEISVYYDFVSAFSRSVNETVFISGFIIEQIGKLITGEAAVEKSLGGPIEIARQAGAAANEGLFRWVRLMAMLSISLGIINLVPIPVLDGGQFLFYLIEWVRGRPLSVRVRELALQLGGVFLVLLMLVVMFFDINRWIQG